VKWLQIVDLGSKRSQYIASLTEANTTGADLLAATVDGQQSFITEMEKNYSIAPIFSRRMFISLSALSVQQNVESKQSFESRFTSDIDPSDTPYQSPIYGVMNKPLMSLKKACESLSGIVPEVDKIAGCALIAAGHKGKGIDKIGLTLDERAAINMYTQESPLYRFLNKALRAKDRTNVKPFFGYLKLLLIALKKLPHVKKGAFWRGVKRDLHKDFRKKKLNNQNHYFWSFKSTTLNATVLENAMFLGKTGKRTLLNIHGFSGVRIEKYSSNQSEAEVLFPPGSCFTVTNILNAGHGLWIVELNEIDNEFPLIS